MKAECVQLLEKAMRIAQGEEGPELESDWENDARYVYPWRMKNIIEILNNIYLIEVNP